MRIHLSKRGAADNETWRLHVHTCIYTYIYTHLCTCAADKRHERGNNWRGSESSEWDLGIINCKSRIFCFWEKADIKVGCINESTAPQTAEVNHLLCSEAARLPQLEHCSWIWVQYLILEQCRPTWRISDEKNYHQRSQKPILGGKSGKSRVV